MKCQKITTGFKLRQNNDADPLNLIWNDWLFNRIHSAIFGLLFRVDRSFYIREEFTYYLNEEDNIILSWKLCVKYVFSEVYDTGCKCAGDFIDVEACKQNQ